MYANYSSKSITVVINENSTTTNENRSFVYFMIELPRNIIDAITTGIAGGCTSSFISDNPPSWVQEHDIDYNIALTTLSEDNTTKYSGNQGELCDRDSRTLSIEYPTGGKSMIVIQGTTMIPEFGSVVMPVAAISIITSLVFLKKFTNKKE